MFRYAVWAAICIVGAFAARDAFTGHPPYNIASGVLAVLAFSLLGMLNLFRLNCPNCQHPQPFFRKPASMRQFLWGGNTCPKCGTEMDRNGRKIEPQKT